MTALDQHPPGARATSRANKTTSTWPGYAAAGVAFVFAAVSLYWVLGGTAGLGTLGERLKELALARDDRLVAITWVAVFLKIAGGLLALALVQSWGRRMPQRLLRITAWSGAGLLIAYGAFQEIGVALAMSGVIGTDEPANRAPLLWHLLLWEPWFLIWGVLLGLAAAAHYRGSVAVVAR